MYNGQKIRLKGQGINGGDLYLKILIEEHPFFLLQGSDICCEIPITPSEAIVGGAIEVPTIDGLVKMNVPPGIKSGQRLKLANKGYPNIRGERGDQLVIIQVVIPTKVSEAEKQLYQQIREIEQFNPRQKLINFYQ
jgi:curved DNA-binding protein